MYISDTQGGQKWAAKTENRATYSKSWLTKRVSGLNEMHLSKSFYKKTEYAQHKSVWALWNANQTLSDLFR